MNKGKRWNNSENNLLINKIINSNENILNEISLNLGRSKFAVIKQLEKLLLQKNIDINLIYEQVLLTHIKLFFNLNNNKLEDSEYITDDIQNTLIKNEISDVLEDMVSEIEETSELNEEQLLCYKYVQNNKNILITGGGGTGKSTSLKAIVKYLKRKNKQIGITSSTGISATLINGTTLHSFLKIGLATKSAKELYDKIKFNTSIYNKLKKLEVLIIDEISMIDNILFNKIAAYLSLIKEIKKPFGKIQLILCGDFYQLPPITNTYCFNSNIWNKLNLRKVELKKQMRQINDEYFQYVLEQVKINNITNDIFLKLSELKNKTIHKDIKPTILYSKNIDVEKINQNEFLKLVNDTNAKIYEYPLKYDKTNSKITNFIKNNTNFSETIKLCIGLQIMVTYNLNINNQITNGTRGIIVDINELYIQIKTLDGSLYYVEYIQYQNELDETITFNYIPLKLAYAITIHKCVNEHTLIYTKNGLKRINKISHDIYGDSHLPQTTKDLSLIIMGKLGYSEATQIYKGNIIETLKITTSLGYILEGSYKHPILTYNNNYEEEWKKLSEIKNDDYIVMKYNTQCFGNYISTNEFIKNYTFSKSTIEYTIPTFVNEQLSYLIGLLIGDGSYSTMVDYPIDFCGHKSTNIKDIYISYFNELFNANIDFVKSSKNKNVFRILKCSKHIREFLLWCGLKYETAHSKTIPWVILENTKECHINCLKGLFDTDGGVNNDSIHYTTSSKQLIIDIQNLLLNLGIISSVNKLTNNSLKNHVQAYRLSITGYQAHLFYKLIGFNDIKKQEKLISKYGEYNNNKIKSNILEIPNGQNLIINFRNEIYQHYNVKKCNSIPTKLSQFLSRIINKSSKLRLYDLQFIINSIDNISKFGKYGKIIQYIYDNNLIFQKVTNIKKSTSQVYDLYVPGDHSFIGNGIINHNSQGQTLDYVQINLGNDIFEYGMAYVALSRAKTLDSIILSNLSREAFKTNNDVIEFYKN